ncbi:homoserine kinase [Streptomyces griseus]
MAGPAFRAAAVRVRVPATSANLGPGFDALGLSLGLYDDVVVRVADSGLHIDIAGEGAETLPRDENHLLVRSLRTAFDLLGGQPHGLEIVCANRIPHGRGLGSSSAAICAGIVAARAVTTGGEARLDDAALLELATEIEGHPDNVAACLLGGFTLAWTDGGAARAIRMDPAGSVVPVVFVPATPVLTETARGLLPRTVPHVDAAANAGRAALLVEALTRRPELLLAATEDRIHQEYRGPRDAAERRAGEPAARRRRACCHLRSGAHGARADGGRVGRQGRRAGGRGMGREQARSRRRRGERVAARRVIPGDCRCMRGGMFVGAGSVNLKSAIDVFVARCFVSPSGTTTLPGASPTA